MMWAVLVFLFLVYSVGIFFVGCWWVLLGVAGGQLLLMIILCINPTKAIRAFLWFLPVIITTGLFNWIFLGWEEILMISTRLALVGNMTFIFSSKVPVLKFARGVSILLVPLKIFRVNPRDVAVMVAVAITFVPVVRVEYNRIREGMRARGKKRSLKIALGVFMYRILYRASVLGNTLEAKGYK